MAKANSNLKNIKFILVIASNASIFKWFCLHTNEQCTLEIGTVSFRLIDQMLLLFNCGTNLIWTDLLRDGSLRPRGPSSFIVIPDEDVPGNDLCFRALFSECSLQKIIWIWGSICTFVTKRNLAHKSAWCTPLVISLSNYFTLGINPSILCWISLEIF